MCVCSVMSNSATPWTIAHQAPLSMGFSRQEYWGGLSFSAPGYLPDPGIDYPAHESPALLGGFFLWLSWQRICLLCGRSGFRSLGWEDPLEKGKAAHSKNSGLENSMDCVVPDVAKSWTGLSGFHFQSHLELNINMFDCDFSFLDDNKNPQGSLKGDNYL